MSEECRGCVIYGIALKRKDYFYVLPTQCPGSLNIFINKCPCRDCLVKVICESGCEDFKNKTFKSEE